MALRRGRRRRAAPAARRTRRIFTDGTRQPRGGQFVNGEHAFAYGNSALRAAGSDRAGRRGAAWGFRALHRHLQRDFNPPVANHTAAEPAKNLLCHKPTGTGQSSITGSHQSQPTDISHRRAPHIEPAGRRQKHGNPIGINQQRQKAVAVRRYRPIGGGKSGPVRAASHAARSGRPAAARRYVTCRRRRERHPLFAAGRNNFFCGVSAASSKSSLRDDAASVSRGRPLPDSPAGLTAVVHPLGPVGHTGLSSRVSGPSSAAPQISRPSSQPAVTRPARMIIGQYDRSSDANAVSRYAI